MLHPPVTVARAVLGFASAEFVTAAGSTAGLEKYLERGHVDAVTES